MEMTGPTATIFYDDNTITYDASNAAEAVRDVLLSADGCRCGSELVSHFPDRSFLALSILGDAGPIWHDVAGD